MIYRFGTHPSGPSEILVNGEYLLLKSFIEVAALCFFSYRNILSTLERVWALLFWSFLFYLRYFL